MVLDESPDAFHGAVCVTAYSSNLPGKECLAGSDHQLDVCSDGSECFLSSFASGDNRCHIMCVAGSACANGACADVFGLFGTANPVGLCL